MVAKKKVTYPEGTELNIAGYPKRKPKVGRPSSLTPETIAKLEVCFETGMGDRTACAIAGVHPSVLYRYQQLNPEFRERKELLKRNIVGNSYVTVSEHAKKDPKIALEVLKKYEPERWGDRKTIDINVTASLNDNQLNQRLSRSAQDIIELEKQLQITHETSDQEDHSNDADIIEAEFASDE